MFEEATELDRALSERGNVPGALLDRAQSEHAMFPGRLVGWSTTFFLLPAFASLCAVAYVLARRPSVPRLLAFWSVSWPIGFMVWMLLWFNLGLGTGIPAASTIAMSCVGWVLFWAGAMQMSYTRKYGLGAAAALVAIAAQVGFKLMRPDATTPVTLSLTGIALGVTVVSIFAWMKRRGTRRKTSATPPLLLPAAAR